MNTPTPTAYALILNRLAEMQRDTRLAPFHINDELILASKTILQLETELIAERAAHKLTTSKLEISEQAARLIAAERDRIKAAHKETKLYVNYWQDAWKDTESRLSIELSTAAAERDRYRDALVKIEGELTAIANYRKLAHEYDQKRGDELRPFDSEELDRIEGIAYGAINKAKEVLQ